MSVEDYSLKSSLLSRYSPSLMSNPRDEMSRLVTSVVDLVKEECRTTMLHGDMNLSRLMVYSLSSEDSKFRRISRSLKRSGPSDQDQHRFKKKAPSYD